MEYEKLMINIVRIDWAAKLHVFSFQQFIVGSDIDIQ